MLFPLQTRHLPMCQYHEIEAPPIRPDRDATAGHYLGNASHIAANFLARRVLAGNLGAGDLAPSGRKGWG
jgi:hypothetical protein